MVSVYFGLPGCGKTSSMVWLACKNEGKYKHIRCNVPLNLDFVEPVDADWLGRYLIEDSLLLLDEATILFDSRDFKNFGKDKTSFFMMHRHYHCDIVLFVQRWDAIDLKIRSVTERVFYAYRPKLVGKWFTKVWAVPYKVVWPTNDKGKPIAGDISMGYLKPSGLQTVFCRWIFRPPLYKFFDSFVHPDLPPIPGEKVSDVTK